MDLNDYDGQNRIWRAGCTVHWFLTGVREFRDESALSKAGMRLKSTLLYLWILTTMHKGTLPFGVE